jgi:HK97 family phage major capsid protein
MDYQQIKNDIRILSEKISEMQGRARAANRELTAKEEGAIAEMQGTIDAWQKELPNEPLTVIKNRSFTSGSTDNGGFNSIGDIMAALYRKVKGEGYDERLKALQIRAAAVGETDPVTGGYMIPSQFVGNALKENLEDTILLQLCDRFPMTTDKATAPGFEDNDHSSTSPYGITWGPIEENASFGSLQAVNFRSLSFVANKQGAIFAASNEWLSDTSTGARNRLENIFRASLRWYVESLLWNGTGAGCPLGALVGDGAVTVPIESGQHVTLVTENIVKTWSLLRPGSHSRAIWVCNQTCFPQLSTLSLAVGTGGAPVNLLQPLSIAGAPATGILGRPLYTSEHLPALGTSGDLVLLDPMLYLLGDRQQIILDASPHLRFDYDQTVFRAQVRLDAMPVYNSTLTPAHGSATGWLVKIAARSA